jgi:hypothetical protein
MTVQNTVHVLYYVQINLSFRNCKALFETPYIENLKGSGDAV